VKIFSKVAEMIMETMQTTKNGASFLYQNGACPLWGALCVLSQFIDKSLNSEQFEDVLMKKDSQILEFDINSLV